jgi:hypothetical protein
MKNVTWILERNVFSEECFDQMIKHFKQNDIPYHIVTVIPFEHTIEGKVPHVNGPVVVYGSIGTQKLAIQHGWFPGVWTNDGFNEKVVIHKLARQALNYGAGYCKLSEVPDYLTLISASPEFKFFIKPNTDTKEFAGTTITLDNFASWYQNMLNIGYLETDDFEVMIALPRHIGMEFRLVMIDGKVCECSIYRQYQIIKSERFEDKELFRYAEAMAKLHSPADVFVMDIANTAEGFKVVEYNTFNSAGLYKCHVGNIIDSINKHVEKIWENI